MHPFHLRSTAVHRSEAQTLEVSEDPTEVRLHDKVDPTSEYLKWHTVEFCACSLESSWAKRIHMSRNIRWQGDQSISGHCD